LEKKQDETRTDSKFSTSSSLPLGLSYNKRYKFYRIWY